MSMIFQEGTSYIQAEITLAGDFQTEVATDPQRFEDTVKPQLADWLEVAEDSIKNFTATEGELSDCPNLEYIHSFNIISTWLRRNNVKTVSK